MIMFACNLNFNKVSIKPIEEKCGVSVKILNDADAAAYGEYVASGSKADSFICITLGTGIGSGIIINGKIYNGFNGAGGEIGHTTLIKRRCTMLVRSKRVLGKNMRQLPHLLHRQKLR